MSTESVLKPCPFCGKEPTHKHTAGGAELFIECECGCRMFGGNDVAVIESWNKRADDPQLLRGLLKLVQSDPGNWLHSDLEQRIEDAVGAPEPYRAIDDPGAV